MSNFCENCGSPLPESAKFCVQCGQPIRTAPPVSEPLPEAAPDLTAVPDVPAEPKPEEPVMQNPIFPHVPQPEQSVTPQPQPPAETDAKAKKKKERKPKKKAEPPAALPAPEPAEEPENSKKRFAFTVSGVLCAAFLAVECLPYLLKSLLFLLLKHTLAMPVICILDLCGYAAAAGILLLGAKQISGKPKLPQAILLPALLFAQRSADSLLAMLSSVFNSYLTIALTAARVLLFIVLAAAAVGTLGTLFSPKGKCRRRGRPAAFLLVACAGLCISLFPVLWALTPFNNISSFFGTMAFKMAGGLAEAALVTAAANHLLKKQGEETAPAGKGSAALVFGTALAAFAFCGELYVMHPKSVPDTVLRDVQFYTAQGALLKSEGDMNLVLNAYLTAAEHATAWKTAAGGDTYSVPEQFRSDTILQYIAHMGSSADTLKKYLAVSLDESEIDVWCPMLIDAYREKQKTGELSDTDKAHLAEAIGMCIADECFYRNYPTAEELKKDKTAIQRAMNTDSTLKHEIEAAEVIARIQRGEVGASEALKLLFEAAESDKENMNIQLLAGYLASENTWDGSQYSAMGCDALERYAALRQKAEGGMSDEALVEMQLSLAEMMQNMNQFERAVPLLEAALEKAPENTDVMQKLSVCYSTLGNDEKGYDLNQKLRNYLPNEPSVLWSCCIGELKQGKRVEAVRTAAQLADIVQNHLDGNRNGEDQLLFHLVMYLAVNDSDRWTDYQYRVFEGDERTDPEVLSALKENTFLYEYVSAASLSRDWGARDKMLPAAQKVLAKQPESGRANYLCALACFTNNDYEEALKYYLRADELNPDDPTILFGIANTYDKLGEYEAAYDYCKRTKAHFPNGSDHGTDLYGVSAHLGGLMNSLEAYLKGGS